MVFRRNRTDEHKGRVERRSRRNIKPDAQITRAELAAIVTRYNQQAWAGQAVIFNDVAPDHWAAGNITRSSQNGWVTGYSDGSFKPNQAITRAETVTNGK